jgi:hypothetical protein
VSQELSQIIDRLGRMEGKQDAALTQLGALAQGSQDKERRIEGLEATVYGNGVAPGLKQNQATQKTACDARHAPKPGMAVLRGVVQTIIAAAILAIAGGLFDLWKSHH